MRLPNTAFSERPWRIHEFIRDFKIEDVWDLDTPGPRRSGAAGPAVQQRAVRLQALADVQAAVRDPLEARRPAEVGQARARHQLARPSLRDRLPEDLREGPRGPDLKTVPMTSVYQIHDEWVTEVVNKTVHAVMHIGWVDDGNGGHHAQMAVLVRTKGLLGKVYMPVILPFRRLFVTPSLVKAISRSWQARPVG
ncbi:DUF2867 domain-containing protein [Streptomyces sp. M19]